MFKKLLLILFSATILFSGVSFSAVALAQETGNLQGEDFMFDVGIITHEDIDAQGWIKGGINFVFEKLIGLMAATIGSIAVLIMVLGGFRMIIFAGNSDEFEKAKGMIKKAALGLVFVLGAYIMVTAVQLLIKSIYA